MMEEGSLSSFLQSPLILPQNLYREELFLMGHNINACFYYFLHRQLFFPLFTGRGNALQRTASNMVSKSWMAAARVV